jgi:hypothetical protein
VAKGIPVRFAGDTGSGGFHESIFLVLEQAESRDRVRRFNFPCARLSCIGLPGVEEPLEPAAPSVP